MWLRVSHRYQSSGNFPVQRWAWNLLLAAIFKKSSSSPNHWCSLGQSLWSPRLLFMTLLVVSTHRMCQRAAYSISPGHLPCETNITSPPQPSVTWGTGGSFTTPTTVLATASCTLQFRTPAASLLLLWENRRDGERDSFLHPKQPTSPRLACEKGFLLHWGDLLPWGWGSSPCSGRAQLGQAPWGKHPSKVHLWHSQCCCPQGVPGPPEDLPPPGPRSL